MLNFAVVFIFVRNGSPCVCHLSHQLCSRYSILLHLHQGSRPARHPGAQLYQHLGKQVPQQTKEPIMLQCKQCSLKEAPLSASLPVPCAPVTQTFSAPPRSQDIRDLATNPKTLRYSAQCLRFLGSWSSPNLLFSKLREIHNVKYLFFISLILDADNYLNS